MKKHSLAESFGYALNGIRHAIVYNRNLKIHIFAAILVFLFAFILKIQKDETLDLGVMILLVISAEMINTSLEEMTDLITTEHRLEAKIAKDVSAGMVLVVSIGAALVGIYIFLPYILRLI